MLGRRDAQDIASSTDPTSCFFHGDRLRMRAEFDVANGSPSITTSPQPAGFSFEVRRSHQKDLR